MPRTASGHATLTGVVRTHNEDSLLDGVRLWVVADGMGGHAAGDVASALAIEALRPLDAAGTLRPDDLVDAVGRGHEAVREHGRRHPATLGLGTTVTGVALVDTDSGPGWVVFNVGDSRVYRLADGELTRVTTDHSEVELLVHAGVLTPEQARVHPLRNIITRSVGQRGRPAVDLWELPLTPGERFLVCSDGLTGELEDAGILALLSAEPDPGRAASALAEAAVEAGGHDNVSVVVVDLLTDDAPQT